MINYQIINLHRKNGRAEGGLCIFIHESTDFKETKELGVSKNDCEILSIEITNETKNIALNSVYKPPDSSLKEFKNSLKAIFDNIRRNNKDLYLAGDFIINVLAYENNVKAKCFANFAFQNSLIPLTNKPTRFTRTSAAAVDHILTNSFLNKQIDTGIIKAEISDHFPIFLITDPITLSEIKSKRTLLYKRTINTPQKKILRTFSQEKPGITLKKLTILIKPIANFCVIFPHFMRKLSQN